MHELSLLINIGVALVVAFFGGLIARRLGLPTIVGYLLAGIIIGPFTPGFIGDSKTIGELAELGVVFLMFGVGLHFSFKNLWKVRSIAIPGALIQMTVATLLGFGISRFWGWSPLSGLVLGLALSIASTVVLLRGLMDKGLLNTPHGQAAVGWLILEDLATVLILVLIPILVNSSSVFNWSELGLILFKEAVFILLVLFVGMRFIPWLLMRIAYTRSRELFILAVLAIALGIALGAAEIFGVSLALGAFVAGVVVNESPLSHQVGADALPFREIFTVLFFVSIGMLVNPVFLFNHIGQILVLTLVIVLGKPIITLIIGLLFPWPVRTSLVVAAGLSQIGEFSFILGQAGVSLGILNPDQYSLILAGALLSITINPLMFQLIDPLEKQLERYPTGRKLLNRHPSVFVPIEGSLENQVVIIGYGRVGSHLTAVLSELAIPILVVESDAGRVEVLERMGIPNLFGDAANSEVLTHAELDRARALVITIHDEAADQMIVASTRLLAPELPIIARAETEQGARQLTLLGAEHVIQTELEGGLEIVRHTLLQLGFPMQEVFRYTDAVRQDHYDTQINTEEEHRLLHAILDATGSIEITWFRLFPGNPLIGKSLAESNLRVRTGASVVGILRHDHLMANPKSNTIFEDLDQLGFIGSQGQIEAVEQLFSERKINEKSPQSSELHRK